MGDVGDAGADSVSEDAADCCLTVAWTPVCVAGDPITETGVTGLSAAAVPPPSVFAMDAFPFVTAAAAASFSVCGTVLGASVVAAVAAGDAKAACTAGTSASLPPCPPVLGSASVATAVGAAPAVTAESAAAAGAWSTV